MVSPVSISCPRLTTRISPGANCDQGSSESGLVDTTVNVRFSSTEFDTSSSSKSVSSLVDEGGGRRDKIVVATVAGDVHDIGKNIFTTLMDTAGFEVIDLGVDVPAEAIVGAVKKHEPAILGLSALLTTNLEQFPFIVQMLEKEGLRSRLKIIVGGATITEEFARGAGVDAYAKTAVEGVNICKAWTEEK